MTTDPSSPVEPERRDGHSALRVGNDGKLERFDPHPPAVAPERLKITSRNELSAELNAFFDAVCKYARNTDAVTNQSLRETASAVFDRIVNADFSEIDGPKQERRVAVAGSRVDRSFADLCRAAEHCIAEEQEKPLPDNALIAVLCDTIRLTREYGLFMQSGEPAGGSHEEGG